MAHDTRLLRMQDLLPVLVVHVVVVLPISIAQVLVTVLVTMLVLTVMLVVPRGKSNHELVLIQPMPHQTNHIINGK